jgi:hypothetical protein
MLKNLILASLFAVVSLAGARASSVAGSPQPRTGSGDAGYYEGPCDVWICRS